MASYTKEELEEWELKLGIAVTGEETYAARCKKVTETRAAQGDKTANVAKEVIPLKIPMEQAAKMHPIYNQRILITPLMTPDAHRNLAFDEVIGHEMVVRDYNAGDELYAKSEETQRMVGDYVLVSEDVNKPIVAKTTFPKIGTEISWNPATELCPVARGNDGQRGYVWSLPTCLVQVNDTMVQIRGLKTLIENACPELLERFSGKPMMSYVDGVTLVASIPMTNALLKEHTINERKNKKAGLI